jgi:hypothetical protein
VGFVSKKQQLMLQAACLGRTKNFWKDNGVPHFVQVLGYEWLLTHSKRMMWPTA